MSNIDSQVSRSEREIFLEALEKTEGAEREAFLAGIGSEDPALRAAVEELLRNHKNDDFMEPPRAPGQGDASPAPGGAATVVVAGERPGDQIGPYQLLQLIGEGGVGIVFMAEQEVPVRRRVALKVLKPGMDSRSVIARFESERQALALMDHPNIARVLDAGSTPAGRPFFVMDLVRGTRITDYCDQNQVPTPERLLLFIQVCEAIQHAHQKGIIHRDIKPSNILVTLHDGRPVPKVIDFGIAKAMDQKLTDKTVFTEFHSFIGTPAYISPEQAEMSGLDIDTRADIYSLGVLLYELLTGRTPFDPKELIASGLDGMRRTIRESEPMRPSTRVRTMLDAERTTTAQRQRLGSAKLTSLLEGDLDLIILKALEKDRTRRYETASALAADVRHYLDDEPILARPPSATYRLQKLVRRNKLASTALAGFMAALTIGLGVSTWQWAEKSEAYRRVALSEQAEIHLREEAFVARQLAEAQALAAGRRAYAADMNLVQQSLLANNLGRAQELLNRHRPQAVSEPGAPIEPDLRGWEWRYLWQRCRSDALFTLGRAPSAVSTLSVSSDGRWVALGEFRERGLSIRDLRTRAETVGFPGGEAPFRFSPTSMLLAFVSKAEVESGVPPRSGSVVRLWDGDTRRVVADLKLGSGCSVIEFSEDGSRLLTVTDDFTATVWDVRGASSLGSVNLIKPSRSPGIPGLSVWAVSRDLRLMAHSVLGGQVRVLNLLTGEELWTDQAAEENVMALAFSPDGSLLASSGGYVESSIRLWGAESGREIARLEGHRTYVRALVFWPDGRTLGSASGDQTVQLWDLNEVNDFLETVGMPEPKTAAVENRPRRQRFLRPLTIPRSLSTLRGHSDEVWSLALCPDNRTLVSGSKNGEVCVWDATTVAAGHGPVILPTAAKAWAFASNGESIVVLDHEGQLTRWEGNRFESSQPVLNLGTNVLRVLLSPDGAHVAVDRTGKEIEVWNLERGALERKIGSLDQPEEPVTFLASSKRLVTYHRETGEFREWDLSRGTALRSWKPGLSTTHPKAFVSPNGNWSLHLDGQGLGRLRNLSTGLESTLDFEVQEIDQATFSPDGNLMAIVSWRGVGQVWETEPARLTATLRGILQGQHSAAFSPQGDRLAVGSNAREAVKLWDVHGFQELLTLEGQGSMFSSVAFSPDGRALASSNRKGLLHIWEAPTIGKIERTEE